MANLRYKCQSIGERWSCFVERKEIRWRIIIDRRREKANGEVLMKGGKRGVEVFSCKEERGLWRDFAERWRAENEKKLMGL